jgi:hypothetical protein
VGQCILSFPTTTCPHQPCLVARKKRKDEEDSATEPETVPDSLPKRAKKAMPPPAGKPYMSLSSTSIRRVIERSSWGGPSPRLPRGPYQVMQEAKRKEEERRKRKGKVKTR